MRAERVKALAEAAAVEACFSVVAWALQAANPSSRDDSQRPSWCC